MVIKIVFIFGQNLRKILDFPLLIYPPEFRESGKSHHRVHFSRGFFRNYRAAFDSFNLRDGRVRARCNQGLWNVLSALIARSSRKTVRNISLSSIFPISNFRGARLISRRPRKIYSPQSALLITKGTISLQSENILGQSRNSVGSNRILMRRTSKASYFIFFPYFVYSRNVCIDFLCSEMILRCVANFICQWSVRRVFFLDTLGKCRGKGNFLIKKNLGLL